MQANKTLHAKVDILRSNLDETRREAAAAEQLRADLTAAHLQLAQHAEHAQQAQHAEQSLSVLSAADGAQHESPSITTNPAEIMDSFEIGAGSEGGWEGGEETSPEEVTAVAAGEAQIDALQMQLRTVRRELAHAVEHSEDVTHALRVAEDHANAVETAAAAAQDDPAVQQVSELRRQLEGAREDAEAATKQVERALESHQKAQRDSRQGAKIEAAAFAEMQDQRDAAHAELAAARIASQGSDSKLESVMAELRAQNAELSSQLETRDSQVQDLKEGGSAETESHQEQLKSLQDDVRQLKTSLDASECTARSQEAEFGTQSRAASAHTQQLLEELEASHTAAASAAAVVVNTERTLLAQDLATARQRATELDAQLAASDTSHAAQLAANNEALAAAEEAQAELQVQLDVAHESAVQRGSLEDARAVVAQLSQRVEAAEVEVQRSQEAAQKEQAALREQLDAAHEEIQASCGYPDAYSSHSNTNMLWWNAGRGHAVFGMSKGSLNRQLPMLGSQGVASCVPRTVCQHKRTAIIF